MALLSSEFGVESIKFRKHLEFERRSRGVVDMQNAGYSSCR